MSRTGQDLLNAMEMLHPELQNQPGENDVTKSLRALNHAQYYFETLMALRPEIQGDSTGTISTTALTETTAFPAGVLRIDRLQFFDPSVQNRPSWDIENIRRTGGHIMTPGWPYNVLNFVTATSGGGKPVAYYTNAASIFWVPQPDQSYTIRWYGFSKAADITAGGTFAYNDNCMLPMATFATRLIRTGLDDPIENYDSLAQEIFEPVIKQLADYNRDRAVSYDYRWIHTS